MVLTRNQNKRQKTMGGSLGNLDTIKNDDLLQKVASYLPKTSSALFASLFTGPNERQPSSTSKAIISMFEQKTWDEIDFRDLGEDSWSRLSDEDIQGLLLVIDAKNNLKTLKRLPSSLVGNGLATLHGSDVLKELAFKYNDNAPVAISMKEVLPIIGSILSKWYHSLKQLELLEKRLSAEDRKMLQNFINRRYGKIARCGTREQGYYVKECTTIFCVGSSAQGQSCEKCGQMFCRKCAESIGYDGVQYPCDQCDRHLCVDCSYGERGSALRCIAGGAMACRECADYIDANF